MDRWQRREIKLEKQKTKIKQHGKNIGEIYRNAILKRGDENGRHSSSRKA